MTDKHEHLDEGMIHAWLDGALSPDESVRVEAQAAACAECAALVAEARGLVAASSRILSSLDTVPGGVIPGADVGVDQLAALRARRGATTRRWWSDRRIVAAASLVFVAGISSVVWRFAGTEAVTSSTEQLVDAVQPFADSAVPVVTAPPAPSAPTGVSEARARSEEKAEAPPQVREPAPMRLAAANAADSASDMKSDMKKVAATGMALPRSADVANEARRADSSAVSTQAKLESLQRRDVAERLAFGKQQVQQQGAAQGQQSLRPTSQERARAAAAPPALAGAGARLQVVTGVSAADSMVPVTRCYQLRLAMPQARADGSESRVRPIIVADSVQLLNELLPELSDPTWYRAKAVGFVDSALVWRPVDSTTVELRSRVASTPLVVRFNTTPSSLPLPDVGREPGVRAVLAARILCP